MRWSTRLAPLVTGLARRLFSEAEAIRTEAHPVLDLEHWVAVEDDGHNLTTDMILWRDTFYLVHAASPWHIASHQSRLVVWRSGDARRWEKLSELKLPGADIRDPKFAVIHDRLHLFVLKNHGFVAEPSSTAVTTSEDGVTWTPLEDCEPDGWLFWRPKTRDGKTWFVPAYWRDHGKSILLTSEDGKRWREVSVIHEGDFNDETDIEFLPDGRLMTTARLEMTGGLFGHPDACTLVAIAEPPYTTWRKVRCPVTRLDGPNLFSHGGVIYALGRHHVPGEGRWHARGSFLGKKRTALYSVTEDGLRHLSDLPSSGDTGYPGVAMRDGSLYVSYYTNHIGRDYRWLAGMFLPTQIRMAKLSLDSLERLVSLV